MKNKLTNTLKYVFLVLISLSFSANYSFAYIYNPLGTINGGLVQSIVAGTNVQVDNSDPQNPVVSSNFTQTGKYLISGGASWSGTGYVYNVSALSFFFDGNYTASPTTVTFATPDPTHDRIDALVVNQAGTVNIIQGTPSANPIAPVIPDTDLLVQYEIVEAGTTQPTITQEPIYVDYPTANWTPTNYTVSGTPTGSTNFAATNSCYQGTTCIDNLRDGRTGDLFTRASNITLSNYTVLTEWVRFTSPIAANKSLNINWQTSTGSNVGATLSLFNYGISRNIVNTWQQAIIPVTAFGSITQAEKLREIMAGGTNGVNVEWDLDYIILANSAVPQGNAPTIAIQNIGTPVASQGTINFIPPTGQVNVISNNAVNNRVNVTLNSTSLFDTGTPVATQIPIYTGTGYGVTSTPNFNYNTSTDAFDFGSHGSGAQLEGDSTGTYFYGPQYNFQAGSTTPLYMVSGGGNPYISIGDNGATGNGTKVMVNDSINATESTKDLYVDNAAYGLVLKDTVGGACYRIQITSGVLVPTAVTCP